jgi:N-acetylmuramoyl-L-alanine amidase
MFYKGAIAVKLSWLFSLTAISLVGLTQSAWAGKLIYWKFNKPLNRIEFITNEGVQPQAKFVANPARLIIDIPETTVDKSKQRKKSNVTRFIREVRVGQLNRDTARLVVELGPRYTLRASDIKIRSLSPNRWFVQIPNAVLVDSAIAQGPTPIEVDMPDGVPWPMPNPMPPNRRFPWSLANPIPPSKRIPFPDLPPVEMPPSVERPTQNPDKIPPRPSVKAPVRAPTRAGAQVVVIDPGHGGGDPGAVGINGLQEKIAVLSVSHQIAEQLRRKGINAVLTRTGDQEVELAPRVATAARVRADVFVSVHANSLTLSRPDVNGVETYYYASRKGYRLARAIHNRILKNTNMQDRGIRQARFYVIRRTKMPSVLVEIGFVTGSQDADRLASAAQRTQLAEAITQGILDYLQSQ